MGWISYCVSLRLLSPLHIGWKRSSNLQQTRAYVPAKNLWGAMVAQLANYNGNYSDMQDKVKKQLRFSYFYPSVHSDDVSLWPWDNEDEFAWLYLNSYVSTALNNKLADRGYLHETEYIAPLTRERNQVYLIGYVYAREDTTLPWEDVIKHIQLGGERSTGWGRVRLEREPEKVKEGCFNRYSMNCTGDQLYIQLNDKKTFFAHVAMDDETESKCRGVLEPLIGRDTKSTEIGKGFGASISSKICWMPGTVFTGKTNGKFEIDPEGIWKLVNE